MWEKESGAESMIRFFQKLFCRVFGHSKTQIPAVLFLLRDGLIEIGYNHCERCGTMFGEYKRNLTQ